MQNFKEKLNRINPFYVICGYLLLLLILLLFKIYPYGYNISALIGIWKGFAELNPDLIDKGFVIYNDGGYDGQFFYLISKSLFTGGVQSFPILDSFLLRFNRIGLPLLTGVLNFFTGFHFYPMTTLLLLVALHIYSFQVLYKILDSEIKYLAYFYLFSPFSLNSILLLVSDSLFVSITLICVYVLKFEGYEFYNIRTKINPFKKSIVLIFLVAIFTCFVKESGLIIIGTILLLSFYDKNFRITTILLLAIIVFLFITQAFKFIPKINPGTNPLGFTDLIDYPLFGFFKSIQMNSINSLKSLFREIAKFPIFIFYLILILNLKNIKRIRDIILSIPIYFILFTAGVGEVGYWLSFDNISRMFTISIPWIILLKQENKAHKDYYALDLSFIILILLIIRLVFIKVPMTYYIF